MVAAEAVEVVPVQKRAKKRAKEQRCGPAKDRYACVWPLGVIAGSSLRTQHTEHPVSAHIQPLFERPPHRQMGGEGTQQDWHERVRL